nr:phenazine biosynthesis protein PhzF [Raoultella sp. NCTC 9187]
MTRNGDWLTLDFPAWSTTEVANPPAELLAGWELATRWRCGSGVTIWWCWRIVSRLRPSVRTCTSSSGSARWSVSARADEEYDFVSRFFCPGEGVAEDPVTGSAHSMLIPYWGERLGKTQMQARQVSARGGDLRCQWQGERVLIGGQAVTYLIGKVALRQVNA